MAQRYPELDNCKRWFFRADGPPDQTNETSRFHVSLGTEPGNSNPWNFAYGPQWLSQ